MLKVAALDKTVMMDEKLAMGGMAIMDKITARIKAAAKDKAAAKSKPTRMIKVFSKAKAAPTRIRRCRNREERVVIRYVAKSASWRAT